MFSFQGASWISQETQWNITFHLFRFLWCFSQSLTYSLFSIPFYFKKWWAKMDSNHRPHDYQSCALASWAIGPFPELRWWRVPGSNRWPPACKAGALPAELTPQIFKGSSFAFQGPSFNVPSKLNNVTELTLFYPCTDLRTLQVKASFNLKSP